MWCATLQCIVSALIDLKKNKHVVNVGETFEPDFFYRGRDINYQFFSGSIRKCSAPIDPKIHITISLSVFCPYVKFHLNPSAPSRVTRD